MAGLRDRDLQQSSITSTCETGLPGIYLSVYPSIYLSIYLTIYLLL